MTVRPAVPIALAAALALAAPARAGDFTAKEICRAAIATIMSRSPNIIKIDGIGDDGTIYLWYVRWNDRTRWDYKCKLAGDRVLWGAAQGRWQTAPGDSVVTYLVKGGEIEIEDKRADGRTRKRHYTSEQFGER